MNIHDPHTFTITVRANHTRGSLTEEEALAALRSALASSPLLSVVYIASTRGTASTPPVTIVDNRVTLVDNKALSGDDDAVKWG